MYNVCIEFNTLMKVVTLVKVSLNSEWPETKRVSVVMLLNFALECAVMKIKKTGLITNEWNTLVCS